MEFKFKLLQDGSVGIYKEVNGKDVNIGHIFSDNSYSGKNSIQICGFDKIEGDWNCVKYSLKKDLCLIWDNESETNAKVNQEDSTREKVNKEIMKDYESSSSL